MRTPTEIAVRASFRALGFSVLISEPRMPDEGFILAHFAGMPESSPPHPAYTRMFDHFDRAKIEEFNFAADSAKTAATRNRGGGDPDLFVFRRLSGARYFVEVKDEDRLNENQRRTFPLIKSILGCEVLIARLMPSPGAGPTDLDIKPCLKPAKLTPQKP